MARLRRRTNEEWSHATTTRLRRGARQEFAAKGYAAASLDRIARRASATKGAIYHHFGSKERLFEAVFRDAEREVVARINAVAASATAPVDAVIAGCLAFVGVALDDDLRQIAVVDAPAVLGWSRWRAVDAEFGLGSLRQGLEACQAKGHVRGMDLSVLAHLISGALNEAVFVVAEAADRKAAYDRVSAATESMLHRWLDA